MLAGSLCLGASDSFCDVSTAVSDLASPGETEGGLEEGAGDTREEGQKEEEVWRVDGG